MCICLSTDPYVKVWLMNKDKRVEKKKTVVMKRCLNPVFNESFPFDVPAHVLRETTIIITVMDKDRLSRNDVIGKVSLSHFFRLLLLLLLLHYPHLLLPLHYPDCDRTSPADGFWSPVSTDPCWYLQTNLLNCKWINVASNKTTSIENASFCVSTRDLHQQPKGNPGTGRCSLSNVIP